MSAIRWNTLTPRERDALVSIHVFGREDVQLESNGGISWADGKPGPDYFTTYIAAAFQVVEKMSNDGFVFELANIVLDEPGIIFENDTTMHWTAAFDGGERVAVVSSTAPMAICFAALKACGVQVERE